jgi:UDP-2,3-diacylglucosamine hydrolase
MKKFEEGFDAVILGHCHYPLIEQCVVDGRTRTFSVLGDWIRHYSYLLYDNGSFKLFRYKNEERLP